MKILVTGAKGWLGSETVLVLRALGESVYLDTQVWNQRVRDGKSGPVTPGSIRHSQKQPVGRANE